MRHFKQIEANVLMKKMFVNLYRFDHDQTQIYMTMWQLLKQSKRTVKTKLKYINITSNTLDIISLYLQAILCHNLKKYPAFILIIVPKRKLFWTYIQHTWKSHLSYFPNNYRTISVLFEYVITFMCYCSLFSGLGFKIFPSDFS